MQNGKPSASDHRPNSNVFPHSILQERLRQAKISFNIALSMSIATGVFGGILLLFGKVSEGAVTSTGGITSSICWFKLAQDANDRLDKLTNQINSELKDELDHT